jgi:hypothetical protein
MNRSWNPWFALLASLASVMGYCTPNIDRIANASATFTD